MARLTRLILLTLVVASLTLLAACGSRESRRDAHFERAKKYLAEGKSAEGIIELKNTAQIDPKYAPAYGLLGETYLKTNDYRSALSLYNKAVQLAPTDLAYVVPLANILVAARQFDRLNEVIGALPEEARKGYSIVTVEAASLQLRDRGDEATTLLTALLGRQDLKVEERAAVNLALAQMAIQGKRLEEAQGYAQAALAAQPEAVTALLLLARIQEERGDLQAAEATLSGAPAKIADNVR
ncbi:MAG: tetratricopeptide repeat protein, partial [Deltaproteobacteria bacterium]|nr:tetratricopeptide repeat protein [Deltaproteobacteria bacterium]